MIWAVLPASAVIPSLLLMWYFHARDLFREPPRVLWATFGLGVAITVPRQMGQEGSRWVKITSLQRTISTDPTTGHP
jgi:hypothetical protein